MAKLSGKDLAAWEETRDLNSELSKALEASGGVRWVRKTELIPQADGSVALSPKNLPERHQRSLRWPCFTPRFSVT
jgi:hypothetical protein